MVALKITVTMTIDPMTSLSEGIQ